MAESWVEVGVNRVAGTGMRRKSRAFQQQVGKVQRRWQALEFEQAQHIEANLVECRDGAGPEPERVGKPPPLCGRIDAWNAAAAEGRATQTSSRLPSGGCSGSCARAGRTRRSPCASASVPTPSSTTSRTCSGSLNWRTATRSPPGRPSRKAWDRAFERCSLSRRRSLRSDERSRGLRRWPSWPR